MELITAEQRAALLENGRKSLVEDNFDPLPVVKLFTPDGSATWLLTELVPDDPDIAFGLCDLGFGSPELGTVDLKEITAVRGRLNLLVERDLYFQPKHPISLYARLAVAEGIIRA